LFQLSLGRMYHRCRARCVVVTLRWALSLHRCGNRQRKKTDARNNFSVMFILNYPADRDVGAPRSERH
jgi:hypothetical protein